MPPFPKPSFTYNYQLDSQLTALSTYEGGAAPPMDKHEH